MNNGYEHTLQNQLFLCAYLHGKRTISVRARYNVPCACVYLILWSPAEGDIFLIVNPVFNIEFFFFESFSWNRLQRASLEIILPARHNFMKTVVPWLFTKQSKPLYLFACVSIYSQLSVKALSLPQQAKSTFVIFFHFFFHHERSLIVIIFLPGPCQRNKWKRGNPNGLQVSYFYSISKNSAYFLAQRKCSSNWSLWLLHKWDSTHKR